MRGVARRSMSCQLKFITFLFFLRAHTYFLISSLDSPFLSFFLEIFLLSFFYLILSPALFFVPFFVFFSLLCFQANLNKANETCLFLRKIWVANPWRRLALFLAFFSASRYKNKITLRIIKLWSRGERTQTGQKTYFDYFY